MVPLQKESTYCGLSGFAMMLLPIRSLASSRDQLQRSAHVLVLAWRDFEVVDDTYCRYETS